MYETAGLSPPAPLENFCDTMNSIVPIAPVESDSETEAEEDQNTVPTNAANTGGAQAELATSHTNAPLSNIDSSIQASDHSIVAPSSSGPATRNRATRSARRNGRAPIPAPAVADQV